MREGCCPPARGARCWALRAGNELALCVEGGERPRREGPAGAPLFVFTVGVHAPDEPTEAAKAKVPGLRCGNSSSKSSNGLGVVTLGKWEFDNVRHLCLPLDVLEAWFSPRGVAVDAWCTGVGFLDSGPLRGAGVGFSGVAFPDVEPLEVEPELPSPGFIRPSWIRRSLLICSRA